MTKVSSRALILVALAVVSLTLPGCSDEDLADAAEIIAGAVLVGAAIAGAPDSPDQNHFHAPNNGFGDNNGPGDHGSRPGGPGPGSGGPPPGGGSGRGSRPDSVSDAQNVVSDESVSTVFKSNDSRVQDLAAKYEVSDYAATYVVRAILLAEQKDSSGITDLGLQTEDFATIYNGGELPSDKIDTLSKKLLISQSSATSLVQKMTSDIQTFRDR